MAEGYEPYHVPQQSRRDKLRVVVAQNHQHQHQHHHPDLQGGCASAGLLPLYDPSSLFSSSDLLQQQACANNSLSGVASTTHEAAAVTAAACSNSNNNKANHPAVVCVIKEEGPHNLMGTFVGGGIVNASSSSSSSSSAATHHHPYLDPHHSLPLNPTSIHDINSDSFLYSPHNLHNLRDFDHHPSYNAGGGSEVQVFKPEPSTGQGLSLSLSSHHTHQANLPLELNLQRYGPAIYGGEKVTGAGGGYIVPGIVGGSCSASNEMSRSSVPLGPFTGYASILKGSRFLKPAQQLLEELCDVGRGIYGEKMAMDSSLMDPPVECFSAAGFMDDPLVGGDGGETRRKKSRLISMLDEVYRRYKQYFQQMQAVVASFECVAGLGNAAPFANLALKAMSKHFRSLKIAITDQLQFNSKAHGPPSHGKEEAMRLGNTDRSLYSPRHVQNSGFIEHQPVWRPQRGLPERAVTVLRAWLFEHFLHPYPTDTDKLMLAKQTGLSRSQVSNWFINARVRLWKPMVEEIHMLETRQAQKASQREERNANKSSDQLPPSNAVASDNPSTSAQRIQEAPSKRTRNDLPDLPLGSEEQLNLSYNHLPSHPHIGVGVSMPGGGSGVSLTLGLHQNNGIGLSEPFSISAAQRFGLGVEANNEGYVMGGFGGQSRHFGRDVIGGQLLHDFVG